MFPYPVPVQLEVTCAGAGQVGSSEQILLWLEARAV